MTSKKFYIIISLVAISGLLISIAFFPSKTDTPLMYFYDKQYEKAYVRYKELYENGDRSISVVIPLVNILFEYAQVDEAIRVMEGYVEQHPNSIDARKLLGKIYLNAHRSYDYLRNLEKIYTLDPTIDILREKEKYYGYVGDTEREIKSLELILKKYKPTEGEYLELAYRYALGEENEKAVKVLDRFLAQHSSEKMDTSTAEFAVHLLADQGRDDEAFMLALDYQESHPDPEVTLSLVSAFQKLNLNKMGLEVIDNLDVEYQNYPSILTARVNLMLADGLSFFAYEFLLGHFAAGDLPRALLKDLLVLAIEYRDISTLETVVRSEMMDDLPEFVVIKMVDSAIVSQRFDIVETLSSVFDREYLTDHPALAIALMLGDSTLSDFERNFLSQYYDTESFSNFNKALLGKLCEGIGYQNVAKGILLQIDGFEGIPNVEIDSLAFLFLRYGLTEHGWKIVNESLANNPDNKVYERAWVLLGSGMGKTDEIFKWFKNQEMVEENLLRDAFYVANDQKQASLSLHLANMLFELRSSDKHQRFVAEALLLNGYVEQAYEIFNELLDSEEDVFELYVTTLVMLASKDHSYQNKLKEVVDRFLNKEALSDVAMRNLGYLLIEYEWKEQAEEIFLRLTKGKSYDAPDVQSLLGLWGEELAEDHVAWIVDRAGEAEGREKGKWLRHLLDTQHYAEVLALVNKEEWEVNEIADVYMEALIFAKQKETLGDVIAYLIPQESRLPQLRRYGKLARDEGLTSIAATIYHRILQQSPNDADSCLALGGIFFSKGEYCQAKKYVEHYFRNAGDDYLGNYYYGELLIFEDEKRLARIYYRKALCKIRELEEPDIHTRSREAYLLYKLGYIRQALKLYDVLLEEAPDDLYLRADYANVLIEIEEYYLAEKLLFCENPQTEDLEAEIALALARVRYLKERNCYRRALCLSRKLLETYEDSAAIKANRADIEFVIGRWRRALYYAKAASSLQPQNESYQKAQKEIFADNMPELILNGEYRKTGQLQKEIYYRIHSSTYIYPFTLLTAGVESDHIKLDMFSDIDDATLKSVDCVRYRGDISLKHDFLSGHSVTGSLYYASHVFGGGLTCEFLDLKGSTFFVAEYNRSDWDYTQTVVEHGSRDMVALSRHHYLAKRLEATFGVSFNRYNLKGFKNAATSYAFEGQVTYAFFLNNCLIKPFGDDFYLSLNYSLDGEYTTHIESRKDPLGVPFQPFLLENREFHSGTLFVSKRFSPYFAIEGFGGYSYDRTVGGKCVPLYAANAFIGKKDSLEGHFTYSHSPSTTSAGADVDSFILNIVYKW